MLSKASFRYQLFVFKRIFLQTSCCLVGSPGELYPQVRKEIINLTAWFSVLYQRNYFIFLQRVCSKVTLPGWVLPFYLRHCNCDWLNHTTCSNGSCWRIPRCMVTAILFPVDQVMCDWLNHTMWFHSNRALPRSMELESPIYYVGCLMIAHTWIYISLLPQEYCYLGKQKNSLYFLASACKHFWSSHSHLVNCAKCDQISSKYVADWSVWKVF